MLLLCHAVQRQHQSVHHACGPVAPCSNSNQRQTSDGLTWPWKVGCCQASFCHLCSLAGFSSLGNAENTDCGQSRECHDFYFSGDTINFHKYVSSLSVDSGLISVPCVPCPSLLFSLAPIQAQIDIMGCFPLWRELYTHRNISN